MHCHGEERSIFWAGEQHMQRPGGRIHERADWDDGSRAIRGQRPGWAQLETALNFRAFLKALSSHGKKKVEVVSRSTYYI